MKSHWSFLSAKDRNPAKAANSDDWKSREAATQARIARLLGKAFASRPKAISSKKQAALDLL